MDGKEVEDLFKGVLSPTEPALSSPSAGKHYITSCYYISVLKINIGCLF